MSLCSGFSALTIVIEGGGPKMGVVFLPTIFFNSMIGGAAAVVMMSCQVAALARDGGLIYNDNLVYVSPRSNMLVYTVSLLTIGVMLMLCLSFSLIASQTIYSLAVIAVMVLYALAMACRICDGGRWVPGPWNYGKFSKPIHIIGLIVVVHMTVMECFPLAKNWTPAALNYN